MNALATLWVPSSGWFWPAIAAAGVAVVIVVLAYRGAALGRGVRLTAAALKLLGLAALAICLLEPMWIATTARPGANLFVVLADNSRGMGLTDRGLGVTRAEHLSRLVEPEVSWMNRLALDFQLRQYTFDERLSRTDTLAAMAFDGSASDLHTALRSIASRYRNRPLAGVLVLTDGNATDEPGESIDLGDLPPVYPVVIGTDSPAADVALTNVAVTRTTFEDAPVSVQADVTAYGLIGRRVTARVLDPAGEEVATQTDSVKADPENLSFRFNLQPKTIGIAFYTVEVSVADQPLDAASSIEATLENNRRAIVVERGGQPLRVLYVSGRPNWEFKFLRRSIDEDQQLQMVGLIRIARKEPKFEWRGRPGETSNPLFRGFDRKDEQTESYDQPVLIRLNTRDPAELRDGFPKTAEQLYGYHAVVIDDLEAAFFTPDQLSLLHRFVSERGGAVLMLGGQESFEAGGYERTPVGEMLPVYLGLGQDGPSAMVQLELTREGWLQPWARLADNEPEERRRREAIPSFRVFNNTRAIKPGASIIAMLRDEAGQQYPGLAVQRFGAGRTAAMLVGDVWRWGMQSLDRRADMEKSWRQLMRWLVADVPGRFELRAERSDQPPRQAVTLRARVRDEKFKPMDTVTVRIDVEVVSGKHISLTTEPSLSEAGLFEAVYVPRDSGGYRATAVISDEKGNQIGQAPVGWASDLAADEFRSLTPNRGLLASLASRSGGQVIDAAGLDKFAQSLPTRRVPITDTWRKPLWHTPAVFAFALLCFVAEWGLRRWKGAP